MLGGPLVKVKSIKNLLPEENKKISTSKKMVTHKKTNTLKDEYRTLMSNILVNESSHNLKLLSTFNPEKDNELEMGKGDYKLKIKASDLLGEQKISRFNDTQLKIWDYILTKANFTLKTMEIKSQLTINLAELCDFLGLTFQTRNIENLINDLNLMSTVKLKFKYKGIDAIGNLFTNSTITKKSEIVIILGSWIETIKQYKELQSYMLVNSKTYTNSKTKSGSDPHYIVSRKIHEIYKNNFSKHKKIIAEKGQYEIVISAETFIRTLCWPLSSLKKDTKKFRNKLIDILKKIELEQQINFDIIDHNIKGLNNFELFLKSKFVFYSEALYKEYKEKGYN